jgi:hypothetical protein
MRQVKTAKGRILDMGALAAQNEETRAISNMPINARGDIIDNRGKVKVSREDISKEFYKDNVPGAKVVEQGIKEEIVLEPTPQPEAEKPTPQPEPVDAGPVEISRNERERKDGSKYYEVEYMDGSMEEIDIPQNKDKK